MEVLPQDIIVNILSRLPSKSIGRSPCVSKPWKSLLSQPHFIKTHLNRIKHIPTTQESLLFVSNDSTSSFYSVHFKNAHYRSEEITVFASKLNLSDRIYIRTERSNVASCDGLILLNNEPFNKWLLVNPTTTAMKELPISPFALKNNITMCGLGYDSVNDDYKVINISYVENYKKQGYKPYCTEAFVNVCGCFVVAY
ncbi:F-box protein CPR30-like [Chenopodium quinoa]|uniref:F-box protein CPR30-like n=1 Tax=Chenopodium quinoa TaxID=63459 RepID=UPI000B789C53|nr:F-box protein CPR30-like [Chenopodium quinoa]